MPCHLLVQLRRSVAGSETWERPGHGGHVPRSRVGAAVRHTTRMYLTTGCASQLISGPADGRKLRTNAGARGPGRLYGRGGAGAPRASTASPRSSREAARRRPRRPAGALAARRFQLSHLAPSARNRSTGLDDGDGQGRRGARGGRCTRAASSSGPTARPRGARALEHLGPVRGGRRPVAAYRKIHRFGFDSGEAVLIEAGRRDRDGSTSAGHRLGPRHLLRPALPRAVPRAGRRRAPSCVLVPGRAGPRARVEALDAAGPGAGDRGPGRTSWPVQHRRHARGVGMGGHSQVVDPRGAVLAEAGRRRGGARRRRRPGRRRRLAGAFPVLADRRL